MKKLVILLCFFPCVSPTAQTLFTYGKHAVSRQEFLQAYNKNNNGQQATEKDYRDYLDLYIRFKLKVQAALDKKMDTLPNQEAELQSFRNQIIGNFMNDDSTVRKLVREAFIRSQKDIHLAHIFIPFATDNSSDTLMAYRRAIEAYNELKKGTDFGNVASIYSADTFAISRHGDIGYITVFNLPYELENLAYSTPPGKFSAPYHSAIGYHIFRNIEERKAIGKIKAAQILLQFPPNASAETRNKMKLLADSLYQALEDGASFPALAAQFSNDNLSYQLGGEMEPFGVGTFDPVFEKSVFGLTKDGAITRPLLTNLGYHIVKRLAMIPVNTDSAEAMADLKRQVLNDGRVNAARAALVKKAYEQTRLNKEVYDEARLLDYYRDHLETYNQAFAAQMKEFKEGNLLFEIMQSRIWEKAAEDSTGLKKYYLAHQAEYYWPASADVIIFTSKDSATATAARAAIAINTPAWRDLLRSFENSVQADSGRYELAQLPVRDTLALHAGAITSPLLNPIDKAWHFLFIQKKYPPGQPRSFEEAQGFVLNDYQEHLENEWIKALKKKYPVKINEEVLKRADPVSPF